MVCLTLHGWKMCLMVIASFAFMAGCGQQGAGPVATRLDATPVAAHDTPATVRTCTLRVDTMT